MNEPVPANRAALPTGRIIGVFLGVFGVAVLTAIAFTPTGRGQLVNLICGLAILAAAALFYRLRNPDPTPPSNPVDGRR